MIWSFCFVSVIKQQHPHDATGHFAVDTSKCTESCRLGMSDTGLSPIADADVCTCTGYRMGYKCTEVYGCLSPALQTSSDSQNISVPEIHSFHALVQVQA